MAEGTWFVYRSPYEGPSGRRVRRLPDASPLAWFQRMWQTTAGEETFVRDVDAYAWVDANLEADLGGRVYGLNSIFCSWDDEEPSPLRADRGGPLPASTWQELRDLLRRHLYVEGDHREHIRVDEHSVRAATDDDEVDLAYYFIDDALAARSDRASYPLLEDWRLPVATGTDGGAFDEPAGLQRLTARHGGKGTTYVIAPEPFRFLELWDPLPRLLAFVGIRLPELAHHLRSMRPGRDPAWPDDLLALRALVAPGDRRIGPALRRHARSVGRLYLAGAAEPVRRSATEDHATARATLDALLRHLPPGSRNDRSEPDAARSRVCDSEHLAQALVHLGEPFGYQRWYLFDDVWAAGQPELAASLLRYVCSWDPFGAAGGPPEGA
jgi:hypothetical protein